MDFSLLPGEQWYGGAVTEGIRQPYTVESDRCLDLTTNRTPNPMMPLLLSTKGRWLWNPEGMKVRFSKGRISCTPDSCLVRAGETLREAYLDAMARAFPFSGKSPAPEFLEAPVYNTWIELTFYQNQAAVLRYAQDILDNGFPPGILMIDDGWSDYYGRWRFSSEDFPEPAAMLRRLQDMGFSVMLWVCPFITPDTCEFRELAQKGLLVETPTGEPHIAHWWNGYSALLDMTNPQAAAWLKGRLDRLMEMGVKGFKFDAGDSIYYPSQGPHTPEEHSRAWASFGAQYPYNEFRVTYGSGGWPLVQRLCDKDHSWGEKGLAALIPDAIVESLTGHPFLCPDMIGGGEYRNFYAQGKLDGEIFVRWAQIACLMPVMQFSAAPWRVLTREQLTQVRAAVALRTACLPELRSAWDHCLKTGEPILRPLSYSYPGSPHCADQFTLGKKLLVAPQGRTVYLPEGTWLLGETPIHSPGDYCTVPKNQAPVPLVFRLAPTQGFPG